MNRGNNITVENRSFETRKILTTHEMNRNKDLLERDFGQNI